MIGVFKSIKIYFLRILHWIISTLLPPWYKWPGWLALIPLVVHRKLLQAANLHAAPLAEEEPRRKSIHYRPDDGYGTDATHPSASALGAPFGRNCRVVPLKERNPKGSPHPQLVAQKLLARTEFKPTGEQLNVLAAAWIQAMVHGWAGHYDDDGPNGEDSLDKGAENGCPMKSFKFRKTLKRAQDDEFNSFRTQWWDSSWVYGQSREAVQQGRAFKDGKFKTNPVFPNAMPRNPPNGNAENSVQCVGDVKNSWVGISLLQELFLREHNLVVETIAKKHPELAGQDDRLFHMGRLVISAIVAKIHTIDWTEELLKTKALAIGMHTNWYGLPKALGMPEWVPPILALTRNKKAVDHGSPFCLTEEFVAVYRLHPLLPDGLYAGKDFVPLENLAGLKGDAELMKNPNRPEQFWDSVVRYPCGNLELHNYPVALRSITPTEDNGESKKGMDMDLAAIDIYRDRERGILPYNKFRLDLGLKPFRKWHKLTGEKNDSAPKAKALIEVYGENGIDKLDLLVGNLAEAKIPGFAISETSFVIFLLMASRRLEADPFLHEFYTEDNYSKAGMEWIEKTESLKDVLLRHYPKVVEGLANDHSAFKPRQAWPTSTSYGSI